MPDSFNLFPTFLSHFKFTVLLTHVVVIVVVVGMDGVGIKVKVHSIPPASTTNINS